MRIAQKAGLGRLLALGSLALALSGAGYQTGGATGSGQDAVNNTQSAQPAVKGAPAAGSVTAGQVVSDIHGINQMEILMGRLAERKGSTARVRRYGTLLARDHKLADAQLLAVARSQRLTVAVPPPSAADQAMMVELQGLKGKAFDRQFLADMKAGHNQALAMLGAARGQEVDPMVRDFVGRLIPILKQHRDLSQRLQGRA